MADIATNSAGPVRWLLDFYLRLGAHMPRRTFYFGTFGAVVLGYIAYSYFSGQSELAPNAFDATMHGAFALMAILWLPIAYGYLSGVERDRLDPVHTTHSPYAGLIVALGFAVIAASKYFGWW